MTTTNMTETIASPTRHAWRCSAFVALAFSALVLMSCCCIGVETLCFVSPMEGQIVKNGQPVAGAEVIQTYQSMWYHDTPITRSTITDKDGRFSFAGVYQKIYTKTMHEPVISQKLEVIDNSRKKIQIWEVSKRSYDEMSELDFKWAVTFVDAKQGTVKVQNGKLVIDVELWVRRPYIGEHPTTSPQTQPEAATNP